MTRENKALIKSKVTKGDIKGALDTLLATVDTPLKNQVLHLITRYNRISQQENQQTISNQEIAIEKNNINATILELLTQETGANLTKFKKAKSLKFKILISLFLILLPLASYFYLKQNLESDKVIIGNVYTIQKGIERPVAGCKVKVTNIGNNLSDETNSQGEFELKMRAKGKQVLELKFIRSGFEIKTKEVFVNFSDKLDTIFTRAFELENKEYTEFVKLRTKLYRETSEVLGFLTASQDFDSEAYQSKIQRFWQLYNVELSAVETPKVESQMVLIGYIIKDIAAEQNQDNRLELQKKLFQQSYKLAHIFKKDNFQ